MGEASKFWATTGTGDGGAGGYSADNMFEIFRSLFSGAAGANLGGVAPDYLNKLAVTGSSSPVSVNTGAALVYGIPYSNSAAVTVAIATPATATRIDRIVLRASWAAQTVRITRIAGTEGAGTPPAMTQSAGVTWDIPLALVSITTGGVITITDARQYVGGLGDLGVTTAKLADLAVTTAKLADDSVTSAKIVDGTIAAGDLASNAVTTAKLLDANVTTAKLADNAVTTAKITDANVTTAKLADANVTNAKLAGEAQTTIKGRAAGFGTGAPMDLTALQAIQVLQTADGAGSGLDADLLDGSHAAAFAAAAHTHGTAEIADNSVTNGKLADVATATVKGRIAAGSGDPTDLTAANLVTLIGTADGAGTGLDADLLDGVQGSGYSLAAHTHGASTLADDAVTNAKLANMAQSTVKGRAAGAGTGDPVDLSVGQMLTLLGIAITTWTNLTLGGDWSAVSACQYRKNGDVVELRGTVSFNGTTSSPVATLPAGYRPYLDYSAIAYGLDTTTPANSKAVLVTVSSSTGEINILDLDTTICTRYSYINLGGINFSMSS